MPTELPINTHHQQSLLNTQFIQFKQLNKISILKMECYKNDNKQ